MKIELTYNEANMLIAILWELAEENSLVIGDEAWKLSESGADICGSIATKLEEANEKANHKTGKDRDLSGSPKGSILEARWSA